MDATEQQQQQQQKQHHHQGRASSATGSRATYRRQQVRSLLGVWLMSLPNCLRMLWSNLVVYVTSYFFSRDGYDVAEGGLAWMLSIYLVALTSGMFLSELLVSKTTTATTQLLGILVYNSGLFLSYAALRLGSAAALTFALGVVTAAGEGVIIPTCVLVVSEWTSEGRRGVVMCLVFAAIDAGFVLNSQLVTWYVNPANLKPEVSSGHSELFAQRGVVERTPPAFLILACVSLAFHLVGWFSIARRDDDSQRSRTESEIKGEEMKGRGSRYCCRCCCCRGPVTARCLEGLRLLSSCKFMCICCGRKNESVKEEEGFSKNLVKEYQSIERHDIFSDNLDCIQNSESIEKYNALSGEIDCRQDSQSVKQYDALSDGMDCKKNAQSIGRCNKVSSGIDCPLVHNSPSIKQYNALPANSDCTPVQKPHPAEQYDNLSDGELCKSLQKSHPLGQRERTSHSEGIGSPPKPAKNLISCERISDSPRRTVVGGYRREAKVGKGQGKETAPAAGGGGGGNGEGGGGGAGGSDGRRGGGDKNSACNPTTVESEEVCLSPRQVLATPSFHAFWLAYSFCDVARLWLQNYYKVFGLGHIPDDHFLAEVGTAMSVVASVCQFVWGWLLDRLGAKPAMLLCSASLAVLTALYFFTPLAGGRWLYTAATLAYASAIDAYSIIATVAFLAWYGRRHFSANYGMVCVASCLTNLTAPPVFQRLLGQWGWFSPLITVSLLNASATIVTLVVIPRRA